MTENPQRSALERIAKPGCAWSNAANLRTCIDAGAEMPCNPCIARAALESSPCVETREPDANVKLAEQLAPQFALLVWHLTEPCAAHDMVEARQIAGDMFNAVTLARAAAARHHRSESQPGPSDVHTGEPQCWWVSIGEASCLERHPDDLCSACKRIASQAEGEQTRDEKLAEYRALVTEYADAWHTYTHSGGQFDNRGAKLARLDLFVARLLRSASPSGPLASQEQA